MFTFPVDTAAFYLPANYAAGMTYGEKIEAIAEALSKVTRCYRLKLISEAEHRAVIADLSDWASVA
jgi:hypothetical protein